MKLPSRSLFIAPNLSVAGTLAVAGVLVSCGSSSSEPDPVAPAVGLDSGGATEASPVEASDAGVVAPAPPETEVEVAAAPSEEEASPEEAREPRRREFPSETIEGEPMYTVLPQDAIPALDEPGFVSAMDALEFMQPEETVLGVVGADGTAKCYSAWQLDSHEIVNDVLDGRPIAATW